MTTRYDQEPDAGFGGHVFYELPYVSMPVATTQRELVVNDPNPFYGLPAGPVKEPTFSGGPSRVGPTVSAAPRGSVDPNLPAGSLFSSFAFSGKRSSFVPRGVSVQRGFTVELQEALRGRRRRRFWETA